MTLPNDEFNLTGTLREGRGIHGPVLDEGISVEGCSPRTSVLISRPAAQRALQLTKELRMARATPALLFDSFAAGLGR